MVIKVADFGLAVNIGVKEYYRLTKHVDVKLPLMWMAPESLSDYMFSEMSDVVSHSSSYSSYIPCSQKHWQSFNLAVLIGSKPGI